jgi:hypothetical protein
MNGSSGISFPTHLHPLKLKAFEQVDKEVLREVLSN